MKNKKKLLFTNYIKAIFILINLLFWSSSANAENTNKSLVQLQQEIIKIQKSANIPALGVVLIDNGKPVWITSLGKANLADNTPVDKHSLFPIGSISKMFIGLAVLKLVEEGKLNLNDKVRDLAPEVTFENKWQETNPVLLVHLLEHTSGWSDLTMAEFAHNQAKPIALKQALMQFPRARASRWPAGTRFAYSGAGSAVASYIVEKTSGMLFEKYITQNFFKPLGMINSTYYKPDNNQVMTTTYINNKPQDYQAVIYRAVGAINSSPADIANFLQFFIQRGEFSGEKLISEASLQRMQTPTTTLGSIHGVTAGYGLTNYTSGFGDYHTAFHGHDGAVNGAIASLAYIPELNSGYVLMGSGRSVAIRPIVNLIREYLLRNAKSHDVMVASLPSTFKDLSGYYKKVNPRNKWDEIYNDLFKLMVFSNDENSIHRVPFLGGELNSSKAISKNLLVNASTGLPSIALVNDPVVGQAVQVDSDLYITVPKLKVWGKLLLLITVTILTFSTLLFLLFWLPLNTYRKTLSPQQITCRIWPSLTCACLVIFISSLLMSNSPANIEALSQVSPLSLTLFVLSLCYPLVTFISLLCLWQLKRNIEKSKGYWLSFFICLIHLLNVFLLASYGMIGLRFWLL